MNRLRIYISGPISNGGNYTREKTAAALQRFELVSNQLLATYGWDCVNPFNIPKPPKATWRECLAADIEELVHCDGIFMLKGYELSKGAKLELHIAQELDLKIYYEQ